MTDNDGPGLSPRPDDLKLQDRLQKYLVEHGEEFETYEVEKKRVTDHMARLDEEIADGRRARGGGYYPGASKPNEPGAPESHPYPDAVRDFGIVKDIRQLTMDTAVEALRGVQRFRDAEKQRAAGGFGFAGRAAARDESVGLGDVLFELGTAQVRTWKRLLKVTRRYGDSWMPEPGGGAPRMPVPGWEVVNLRAADDATSFYGEFALRNASPMQVTVAWPRAVKFVLREPDGTKHRRKAKLKFEPEVPLLEPYQMLDGILVDVTFDGAGLDVIGDWEAHTTVRLADLVDLALTLKKTTAAPVPPEVEPPDGSAE